MRQLIKPFFILMTMLVVQLPTLAQNPFITTWKTDNPGTSNSTSVTLPIISGLSVYNFDVDWDNDGVYEDIGVTGPITHDYGATGTYTVAIRGDLPHIYFNNNDNNIGPTFSDAYKLISIDQWGDIQWEDMSWAFFGCANMQLLATDAPDLTNVTSLANLFRSCTNFNANVNHWDVSNITDLYSTFNSCTSFNHPLNSWNVSNVTDMGYLFYGAPFDQPLDNWNVTKVEDFSAAFIGTDFNQDISGWVTSSATNMSSMFRDTDYFDQDISGWDVSNVENFSSMFQQASEFNQPLNDWNVGKGTDFSNMFNQATKFDQPLNNWNMSSALNLSSMFNSSIFNQDISSWNVEKVTNMSGMFWGNGDFDQPIGSWNVSSVLVMNNMFTLANFNQDISSWNVSNVINMSAMFMSAPDFDQPIGAWNVGSATDMSGMFDRATSFDQSLGNWDIGKVANMTNMLNGSGLSTLDYDLTLIGWANLATKQSDVPLGATDLLYCTGASSRQSLFDDNNWVITGDTEDCSTPEAFITTWKTDNPGLSNSTSIIIPTSADYTYDYHVDWDNDGIIDEYNIAGDVTHDFGAVGTYTIRIFGDFPKIFFDYDNKTDPQKLLDVAQWGDIEWRDFTKSFDQCSNLNFSATDAPDLSNVTSLQEMLWGATSFNSNINHWDVSTITGFNGLFHSAKAFNQPLDNWDVSNGTAFKEMFLEAEVFNQDISMWTVQNTSDFSRMFWRAYEFDQDISGWDMSAATNMQEMFREATNFNQNISGWNVSNVTNMYGMFKGASKFDQNINGWNVGAVTTMEEMFAQASEFNQDLNSWNTAEVTTMAKMFHNAVKFNGNISNWNTSKVTNMAHMFQDASVFDQNIGGWDVRAVTHMTSMFYDALEFNQNISGWQTESLRRTTNMFRNARKFDQNIGGWDMTEVTDMSGMFWLAVVFDQDISGWVTSSAEDMQYMFFYARGFNQDLGDWETGNVTNMQNMFNSSSFNYDLSDWDVSQVTNMNSMFTNTPVDQDFGDWDVSAVASMVRMFEDVTLSTANYDALLFGWNELTLQNGVTFDGGNSKYCSGASARQNMIDTFGWIITDGGSEDSAPPVAVCRDIIVTLDADGNASITADMLDNGSSDDCTLNSDLTFTTSQTTFDCTDIGVKSITVTVADFEGNTATCDSNLTVVAPAVAIASCPSDMNIAATGCSADVSWIAPTVSCGSTLTSNYNSGDTFSVGTTTVQYTATHPDGSTVTCSFDVTVTGGMDVTLNSTANASCFSATDGQGFIDVSGGFGAYTYDWEFDGTGDFDDDKDQSGLPAGDNVVTVRDASGCEESIVVNIGYEPLEITSCPSDVRVITNTAGCQATVNWSSPVVNCSAATITSTHNPGDVFNIGETTVTYSMSTPDGESVTCSFIVEVYNDLTVTVDGTTNNSCADSEDGIASLIIAGGVAPYTIDWSNDGTGDFDDPQDPTNLPAGTTDYVVRDANGCTISGAVEIATGNIVIDNCPADIIMMADRQGCAARAEWVAPSSNCSTHTVESNYRSGTFFYPGTTEVIYTFTDAAGNSASCSFNVTVKSDLTLKLDSISEPSCFGDNDGFMMIHGSGGMSEYQYRSTDAGRTNFDENNTIANVEAGDYYWEVTDKIGCMADTTFSLSQPEELVATSSVSDFNDVKLIDLSVIGGSSPYEVEWSGKGIVDEMNDGDIYVLGVDTYSAMITDANGCVDSTSVEVMDRSELCPTLDFTIYPNPSRGEFNIQFTQCFTPVLITIYDTAGKLLLAVSSKDLINNLQDITFSSGTYIVQVRRGEIVMSKLLMIR